MKLTPLPACPAFTVMLPKLNVPLELTKLTANCAELFVLDVMSMSLTMSPVRAAATRPSPSVGVRLNPRAHELLFSVRITELSVGRG